MLLFVIGIYVFFLAFIWGFFILAKIHAYKFKNFSSNIEKVTNILFFILLSLTIIGFLLIFSIDFKKVPVVDRENVIDTIHY